MLKIPELQIKIEGKDPEPNVLEFLLQRVKNSRKKHLERRKKESINLSERPDLVEILDVVKKEIIDLYKDFGIEVKLEDFPEVLFFEEGKIKNSSYSFNRQLIEITTKKNKTKLYHTIRKIYHELIHSISLSSIILDNNLALSKVYSGLGYTEYKNNQATTNFLKRGSILEEGFVEFVSIFMISKSKSPVIMQAREDYKKNIQNGIPTYENLQNEGKPQYKNALLIMKEVITFFVSKGESEKNKFIQTLLYSRINHAYRSQLVKMLDEAVGEKNRRHLILGNFDEATTEKILTNVIVYKNNLSSKA